MHGQVEVVFAYPVDGAVQGSGRGDDIDGPTPAAQVSQHEGETQPSRQFRMRGALAVHETPRCPCSCDADPQHRIQRDDALPLAARAIDHVGREPVTSDEHRTHSKPLAVREGHPHLRRVAGRRDVLQSHQAITKRQPSQPQSFFLSVDVALLDRDLALELTLEIVEQTVPAHDGDASGVSADIAEVIHSAKISMDTKPRVLL